MRPRSKIMLVAHFFFYSTTMDIDKSPPHRQRSPQRDTKTPPRSPNRTRRSHDHPTRSPERETRPSRQHAASPPHSPSPPRASERSTRPSRHRSGSPEPHHSHRHHDDSFSIDSLAAKAIPPMEVNKTLHLLVHTRNCTRCYEYFDHVVDMTRHGAAELLYNVQRDYWSPKLRAQHWDDG